MREKATCREENGKLFVENKFFKFSVEVARRINPSNLICGWKKHPYADSAYIYFIDKERTGSPAYQRHSTERLEDIGLEVTFVGTLKDVEVHHRFVIPDEEPYLEEWITVKNTGTEVIETPTMGFGFAKSLGEEDDGLPEELLECRIVAVPFRRVLLGRREEYEDYSFEDLLNNEGWYYTCGHRRGSTPEFGAEGWIWTNGASSLLILKHSQEGIEHSLLKVEKLGKRRVLRFGGAGLWHGDPENAMRLEPGEEVRFGVTRYVFVEGWWKEGYYAFRSYMEEQGHGVPKGYNPPIHWNELYDNPLWWGPDTFENRRKLYTLEAMEAEAAKAKELGCEALYLDPGWDTNFGSAVWASYRLLTANEFIKIMKGKYGLDVSLHIPLAGWSDVTSYPLDAHRKDADGRVLEGLCSASPSFLKTKTDRLIELAKAGFAFFMFDGTVYTGPCYDPLHGHSIPLTREEHCRAYLSLAQEVHARFPKVIIELHDPLLGGVTARYTPIYYLHGLPGSFDEVWAFEYMWNPMEDLLSGKAVSLYYYNLAYSLPSYIHIDLRKDNKHALEFWWYASTCRHLGVGGKHPDNEVWNAHKKAMQKYKELKIFYTQGVFYGLDETVHVHTLKERGEAVINIFNLTEKTMNKKVVFHLNEIGLDPRARIQMKGAPFKQTGPVITIAFKLPGLGTALAEIASK